jgi:hypothetical protein
VWRARCCGSSTSWGAVRARRTRATPSRTTPSPGTPLAAPTGTSPHLPLRHSSVRPQVAIAHRGNTRQVGIREPVRGDGVHRGGLPGQAPRLLGQVRPSVWDAVPVRGVSRYLPLSRLPQRPRFPRGPVLASRLVLLPRRHRPRRGFDRTPLLHRLCCVLGECTCG